MKSWQLTCTAGVGLLVPAWTGLFITGVPTLLCPLPLLTVIPAFFLASPIVPSVPTYRFTWLAVFVPAVLFLAWDPQLFRGRPQVPKRSLALLAVLTVLSVVWFHQGWWYGMKYQGPTFTVAVCIVNLLWLALLWVMFVRCWRRPSFPQSLLAHWMLFAWLAWYAFPYLGELP